MNCINYLYVYQFQWQNLKIINFKVEAFETTKVRGGAGFFPEISGSF
jgi:hypothetical protein